MKKSIISFLVIFFLLINPASADLFSDISQNVLIYNQNVDKVPDVIKSLVGNEEIHGIIELNDGSALEVKAVTKDGRIIEFGKVGTKIEPGKGDCNKDNDLGAVDALCAIRMSVGKMPEDKILDVDDNGNINSLDARLILQSAVKLNTEVDPTLVLITNEKTVRNVMDSENPADIFLDALDTGDIKIEATGIVKGIILKLGELGLKLARYLGLI